MITNVIYCIRNIVSNKIYIGSSVNYKNRKRTHLHTLRNNNHKNIKLQNAFNKYGENKFDFGIIETVEDKNNLINREQYHIDKLKPFYNISPTAENSLGIKRSKKFKRKISLAQTGKKLTEEHKKNISLGNKGKIVSQETRRKISNKHSGKILSKEHREKLSKSHLGNKVKKEHLKKWEKPQAEETKKKMSMSHRNRWFEIRGYEYKEIKEGYKRCITCGSVKLIKEFNKNIANNDNLDGTCKICSRKKIRKRRLKNKQSTNN